MAAGPPTHFQELPPAGLEPGLSKLHSFPGTPATDVLAKPPVCQFKHGRQRQLLQATAPPLGYDGGMDETDNPYRPPELGPVSTAPSRGAAASLRQRLFGTVALGLGLMMACGAFGGAAIGISTAIRGGPVNVPWWLVAAGVLEFVVAYWLIRLGRRERQGSTT